MAKYGISILKFIILLIFITTLLFSSNEKAEKKIYTSIIHVLVPNKSSIKIWTDMNKKKDMLRSVKSVNIVDNIDDADLLIINSTENIKTNILKFATSYKMLLKYKKDIVGGFYWQKGRPNILFLKDNIDKYNVKLPASMNQYIESEF